MKEKSIQELPIAGLFERGLMTPSYLSKIVVAIILPAQSESYVTKNNPLSLDRHELKKIKATHTLTKPLVNGLDTLEAKLIADNVSPKYEVFFCGNGQDAMSLRLLNSRIKDKNYIFWNYPGVGCSDGTAYSVHDLHESGYRQVKRLLAEGILAKDITLYGWSLGGGVAAHVALKLHEDGYAVNLTVDRSFSRIAAVIPERLSSDPLITRDPLITSIVALALSGIALGTTFAGFVASLGLLTTAMGYISVFSTMASLINNTINLIGSIVGGAIALAGLVCGILAGLVLGALLSIQLLWTDKPFTLPMTPAFSAALYSVCCEMDSASEISRLLSLDPESKSTISVINAVDDEVIPLKASLNIGIGMEPMMPSDTSIHLCDQRKSMWYQGDASGCNHALALDEMTLIGSARPF